MNFYDNFSDLKLELHGVRLPSFKIEDKFKEKIGADIDCSNLSFLKSLCEYGLKEKNLFANANRFDIKILKQLKFATQPNS